MRLSKLEVKRLFGMYDHTLEFPAADEANPRPTILILYGDNGIGKTTLLRMLKGLMELDFTVFRFVPFGSCQLTFSDGSLIDVVPTHKKTSLSSLQVTFDDHKVTLHPRRPGSARETDQAKVEAFREAFRTRTESLSFQFIDTRRLLTLYDAERTHHSSLRARPVTLSDGTTVRVGVSDSRDDDSATPTNPKALQTPRAEPLADMVMRFIAEAQVNYREFFATTQPDFFETVLQSLTESKTESYTMADLRGRLTIIQRQDREARRLGLEPDIDVARLLPLLKKSKASSRYAHFLTTLGAYVDMLGSRANERALLATRLATFERLMNDFLSGKTLAVDGKRGVKITDDTGRVLSESQLSSGEYHLLYLMTFALVVRRRGTVMAIDEPEMSMHIKWQRKLVGALCECAAGAEPQFLFATHSPDVAAEFTENMVGLTSISTSSD